jgi:2-polyprenyl-6-methoxyphenol hydroxylase-like FAD-dependent oxidoreductase
MKNKGRVLIVGAGITGTALAALLEQKGIIPDVVERMPNWSKTGFGITVMPVGLEVLRKLELITKVRSQGHSAESLRVLTPNGNLVRQFHIKKDGIDSITMDRADLHAALRAKLSRTHIQKGKTIEILDHKENTVEVTFTDGEKKEYDIIIGSDGVHSLTRRMILPKSHEEYSGAAVWTFFLPKGIELETYADVQQVWSNREFMGLFPGSDHVAVTFSAPLDQSIDLDHYDLDKHFDDVGVLSHEIFSKMKSEEMFSGFLNEMKLGTWYQDRVILAGDAAHAMMPATGMGASMGMRDAYVLAELIGQIEPEEWHRVGPVYQNARKRVVDRVQKDAHVMGHLMLWGSPLKEIRNEVLKWIPQFVVTHSIKNQ